jgi:hypothetical protein
MMSRCSLEYLCRCGWSKAQRVTETQKQEEGTRGVESRLERVRGESGLTHQGKICGNNHRGCCCHCSRNAGSDATRATSRASTRAAAVGESHWYEA